MRPDFAHAVVEPSKLRDYLLSDVHPVGRFKSVVFRALGYRAQTWTLLRDDLLALACAGEPTPGQASPYGREYEVGGSLIGPNGREGRFITVWLHPSDGEPPRFITAFPG